MRTAKPDVDIGRTLLLRCSHPAGSFGGYGGHVISGSVWGSNMADTGIHNANDLFTKQLLRTLHVRNSYSSLLSLTVI